MVMTPAPPRPAAPPSGRGPKPVPTSERKRGLAKALRRAADGIQQDHPETILHQHLRDAAAELDRGKTHTAIRHLQTAAHGMTPQSMYRHGATTDDAHTAARRNMHVVTRHILLIKDVQDQDADNRARIERRSYDTSTAQSGSAPEPQVTTDPKFSAVATTPAGPAAMNAPPRTPTGGSKGVAGAPKQPPGSANSQYAHIAAAGGPGGIELGWNPMQPRGHDGRWIAAGMAAGQHGQMVTGQDESGGLHTGHFDYDTQTVTPRHGTPVAVSKVQVGAAAMARARARVRQQHLVPALGFSAETARLAVTPAPRGRPGGPGLYDVKGMEHTPYLQNVVKALIRRGMDPGKAYAIARASIRKWSVSSKHPEVRAAAGAAEAGEVAKGAAAKAVHAHAGGWEQVARLVELAAP